MVCDEYVEGRECPKDDGRDVKQLVNFAPGSLALLGSDFQYSVAFYRTAGRDPSGELFGHKLLLRYYRGSREYANGVADHN